ncbi:hypothetical protein J7K92_00455 [bacterium]|nr:hypothetical protein [bacterium]
MKKEGKKNIDNSSKFTKLQPPKIKILGVGGGGSSIVEEISKIIKRERPPFLSKIEFLAANVDLQAINSLKRNLKTIYFGEEVTFGLGCGMNINLGKEAALKSKEKFEKEFKKTDFCILISSLGGGTGSGASPVIAQILHQLKIPTLGIFTLPFKFEGTKRLEIAKNSLKAVAPFLNGYAVIPNQKVFSIVKPQTSLQGSLSLINKFLAEIIRSLLETIYLPGFINIDFADIKSILNQKGEKVYLATATVRGKNKKEKVVKEIFKNPLFSHKELIFEKIILNVMPSNDVSMKELEEICEEIYKRNPNAKIIFGISKNLSQHNILKILLLAVLKKPSVSKPIKRKIKKEKAKKTEIKKEKSKENQEKRKKISRKKPRKKGITRRNALDIHQLLKETEEELIEEEKKWEVPAFLRKKSS